MSCRRIHSILPELARRDAYRLDYPPDALRHIESCERCRSLLEQERSLAEKLKMLSAATELAPSDDIEERLRAAFRQSAASPPAVPGRLWDKNRPLRLRLWVGGCVAAALFLLVLVVSFRGGRLNLQRGNTPLEKVGSRPHETFARQALPAVARWLQSPLPRQEVPKAATVRTCKSRAGFRHVSGSQAAARASSTGRQIEAAGAQNEQATRQSEAQEREITSDFLPLGYDVVSNAMDSGQLVRVKMPRSSLLSFGLPMNVERAAEPIQADVLVGQDGRARAIRFVNFTRDR